jgi:hypothetical protein
MKLLSNGISNPKILKSLAFDKNYLSYILHLAPSQVSGFQVCRFASEGCKQSCLNTSGNGGIFPTVQTARIRKTKLLFNSPQEFMAALYKNLLAAQRKATKANQTLVVRLNGTSDIDWSTKLVESQGNKNLFELFPNVQFYDYTKDISKLLKNTYKNYQLTFSLSEVNLRAAKLALSKGFNLAVVFDHKQGLPKDFLGYKVIDGTTHDLRFLDKAPFKLSLASGKIKKAGVIVGLLALGKAKKDTTGFVIRDIAKNTIKISA